MELRHLRYFVAACEEGSLQRAAQRMNVAQPALMRRIRDLEEELGCRLLERSSRGVIPTTAGERFYRDLQRHLAGIGRAVAQARSRGAEQGEQVGVGLLYNSRRYTFLNRAIAEFRAERREVKIAFVRSQSRELIARLHDRTLDLAFHYGNVPLRPEVRDRLIHTEHLILALHPDHPAAGSSEPLSLAELARIPLVWLALREGGEYHDALLHGLRASGVEPAIALRAESYEELIDLTLASGGACITAASTVLAVPEGVLTFRAIRAMPMRLNLHLAWTAAPEGSPPAALLRHLDAQIARHQAEIRGGTQGWFRLAGQPIVEVPG
ncbi:LysR substrate-binding domain-containing protein [Novosphingobium bradum]|uniref:LysR substrate-binding domain-containing protein n=1 Tax=Novosphingobium bradum TaxID=1737444 RepID=A0ABV7ILH2_9SPHN